MEPRIRAFLALELPPEVTSGLLEAITELKRAGADVKWSDAGHLHLTLKFLGELPESVLQRAAVVAEDVARAVPPLDLDFRGVGCFPEGGPPRVLWAGCEERTGRLQGAARDLDARLGLAGLPRETRPFAAHVTLGRVRSPRRADRLRALLRDLAGSAFGSHAARELVLIKSDLRREGPIYTALARYAFAAARPQTDPS